MIPYDSRLMPALPAVANAAKMLLRWAAPGIIDGLARLFFSWAGNISNSTLNSYATNVAQAWSNNMANLVPAPVALTEVSIEDLTSPTGPVGVWSGTKAGSRAGGAYTPAACFIVQDVIPRRYRGGHPRNYLLGMDTSQTSPTDGNTWLASYASTVLSAWGLFLSQITGANGPSGATTWSQCNVSYYSGTMAETSGSGNYQRGKTKAIVRTAVPFPDVVIGHNYNPQIGSQRRRNRQSS